MICAYCGKDGVRNYLITESIDKGEKLLVIENVPVIQCPNCGETYLTAETLQRIEVIRNDTRAIRKRAVNVAQFAE